MTCVAHLKILEPSCPYSVPMRDSVHLRKCELRVGICPRVFELREAGLVVRSGKRRCGVTGNIAYAWKVR